jgi:hypothetical protein
VTARDDDSVHLLLGDGTGAFDDGQVVAGTGDDPFGLAIGDLNADGFLDVVTANYGSDDVSVLLNDGAGGFLPSEEFAAENGPYAATIGDFNEDGTGDIAVASNFSANITVLVSKS